MRNAINTDIVRLWSIILSSFLSVSVSLSLLYDSDATVNSTKRHRIIVNLVFASSRQSESFFFFPQLTRRFYFSICTSSA